MDAQVFSAASVAAVPVPVPAAPGLSARGHALPVEATGSPERNYSGHSSGAAHQGRDGGPLEPAQRVDAVAIAVSVPVGEASGAEPGAVPAHGSDFLEPGETCPSARLQVECPQCCAERRASHDLRGAPAGALTQRYLASRCDVPAFIGSGCVHVHQSVFDEVSSEARSSSPHENVSSSFRIFDLLTIAVVFLF